MIRIIGELFEMYFINFIIIVIKAYNWRQVQW